MNCKVAFAALWTALALLFMLMLPPVANWWANVGPEWWCYWTYSQLDGWRAPMVLFQVLILELAAIGSVIGAWVWATR